MTGMYKDHPIMQAISLRGVILEGPKRFSWDIFEERSLEHVVLWGNRDGSFARQELCDDTRSHGHSHSCSHGFRAYESKSRYSCLACFTCALVAKEHPFGKKPFSRSIPSLEAQAVRTLSAICGGTCHTRCQQPEAS